MKFGQLIKYNMRNIFLEKSYVKCGGEITPRLFLTLICIKWVRGDPSTIFLTTTFTQKMQEGSDSTYSSILMLENI